MDGVVSDRYAPILDHEHRQAGGPVDEEVSEIRCGVADEGVPDAAARGRSGVVLSIRPSTVATMRAPFTGMSGHYFDWVEATDHDVHGGARFTSTSWDVRAGRS